jgi:uncharacterized protein with HEPN domain
MDRSAASHLQYILDTLETIRANTSETREEFLNDPNAQDATLMRLQDIGEQLSRIREKFPDFFEQHQDDNWHRFIGLRNIISHGYREIDFDIIWDIVNNKLPAFTEYIKAVAKA